MKCEEMLAFLNEYVDGTIDPAKAAQLRRLEPGGAMGVAGLIKMQPGGPGGGAGRNKNRPRR